MRYESINTLQPIADNALSAHATRSVRPRSRPHAVYVTCLTLHAASASHR